MFLVSLLLILFGITLIGICASYFYDLIGEYFRGDPFSVIERKARAAIEAADLGWLAIASGPFVGLFCGSIFLPVDDWLKARPSGGSSPLLEDGASHHRYRFCSRCYCGGGVLDNFRDPW